MYLYSSKINQNKIWLFKILLTSIWGFRYITFLSFCFVCFNLPFLLLITFTYFHFINEDTFFYKEIYLNFVFMQFFLSSYKSFLLLHLISYFQFFMRPQLNVSFSSFYIFLFFFLSRLHLV